MFGKLSKGLASAGINVPQEVKDLEGIANALEKNGLSADTISDNLKEVLDKKTEASEETKQEMNGKLDKMSQFIKSGNLSPTMITTLVSLGQALMAKDYEKAKTLASSLVTGEDASKNFAVIGEILKMVKQ